jgi:hypothetical protein
MSGQEAVPHDPSTWMVESSFPGVVAELREPISGANLALAENLDGSPRLWGHTVPHFLAHDPVTGAGQKAWIEHGDRVDLTIHSSNMEVPTDLGWPKQFERLVSEHEIVAYSFNHAMPDDVMNVVEAEDALRNIGNPRQREQTRQWIAVYKRVMHSVLDSGMPDHMRVDFGYSHESALPLADHLINSMKQAGEAGLNPDSDAMALVYDLVVAKLQTTRNALMMASLVEREVQRRFEQNGDTKSRIKMLAVTSLAGASMANGMAGNYGVRVEQELPTIGRVDTQTRHFVQMLDKCVLTEADLNLMVGRGCW